ncbi:MAG: hypothetical protein IJK84_08275 [Bacteroidales bacterium]|nr:hypothetical protein [Bacteroidales bacterium]
MAAFITIFTIVAIYIIMGWIITPLATNLLRKYGRCGGGGLSSLEEIRRLRGLIKDPRTSKKNAKWAKFYYAYQTWGFGAIALLIIIMWVCIALHWIE